MLDNSYHHANEVLKSYQQHSLFIGDVSAAEDIEWLKNNRIGVVITVASGFNLVYDHSIVHIRYDLQDNKNENIGQYFDQCTKHIQRYLRTTGVLVHCGAGVSRSATVVIAYLIKYKGMGFHQALKFLKTKRPQICPNLGFQLQLKKYEAKINLSKNLLQRKNLQKSDPLPGIKKMQGFNMTAYNNFSPIVAQNRSSNHNMNKKDKPQSKEQQQFEYLRKMAQFRFGITNMSKWRIAGKQQKPVKKVYDFSDSLVKL